MVRLPPISNWTYTLFPYTTLFRSGRHDPDRGIDRSGNLYGMKAGRQVEPDDLPDAGAARAMFMGCGGQGGGARGGVHPGGGGQRYADARRILDSQGEEAGMAFGDGSAGRNDELDLRSRAQRRSEEHTSELQSLMRISYAVFCLKKKKNTIQKRQYM